MSSSRIVFLSQNDFRLDQNNNLGLTNNRTMYSLIMFSSNKCQHCGMMFDVFANISSRIQNFTFGIVKLDEPGSRELVNMSKNSTIPIEYVPLVVFYSNGVPKMIYSGPPDLNSIMEFIQSMLSSSSQTVHNSMNQESPTNNQAKNQCNIGDEECIKGMNRDKDLITSYTTMTEAYKS